MTRTFDADWLASYKARRSGEVVDTREPSSSAKHQAHKDREAYAVSALEREILPAVLKALQVHPRVAWAARMNSGAWRDEHGRLIRYGFAGLSDILFQLKSGEFGACECKRAGEFPTDEQEAFLTTVKRNGGRAFVARSVEDVFKELEP